MKYLILRKKIAISFIFLATLMILASGMIPHHHHQDSICIVMAEKGEDAHLCNNDHHSNNSADDMANHETHSCVSKSLYFSKLSSNNVKQKDYSCDNHNHLHLFPVFILHRLLSLVETPARKLDYGEYLIAYISVGATRVNGLRAPPFSLA